MSLNPIPKKSASLIIARPFHSPHSIYNYQLLLLKRNSTGSFSNMFAFPGGLYNHSKDFSSLSSVNSLQNTAYRETLEEIGLYFTKENLNKTMKELEEIREEFKAKGFQWDEFNILKNRLDNNLKDIKPFIRLITIPFLKPRYDTQFFFHFMQKGKVLNWRNFYLGISPNSTINPMVNSKINLTK